MKKRIRPSRKLELRNAYAPVTKWERKTESGSGQIAGPCLYRQYRWKGVVNERTRA